MPLLSYELEYSASEMPESCGIMRC